MDGNMQTLRGHVQLCMHMVAPNEMLDFLNPVTCQVVCCGRMAGSLPVENGWLVMLSSVRLSAAHEDAWYIM
jgi:hypothetical protein